VPLFVSSGYSTCHWCHVMHRESFQDEEVAAKLDASFVCVKVDREELPVVDDSLIRTVLAIQGSAGWPCTVFMGPDGKAFYGGTYYPRNALVELVGRIAALWKENRKGIADDAAQLAEFMAKQRTVEKGELDRSLARNAVLVYAKAFDPKNGGFGKEPKFPRGPDLSFLLEHSHSDVGRKVATITLEKIARGGIHDQLGGGFHRYATDAEWKVPHFEKMLYDQALLVSAYTAAFQWTRDETFARAARTTCDYVLRDLRLESGGFASAEDADSAGAEGLFYTWTRGEVERALGDEELARVACTRWGIEPAGAGPVDGRSVARIASDVGSPDQERIARETLLATRAHRVRPPRDDKVLVGWNALMIGALARASVALDEPRFLEAAREAVAVIESRLVSKEGRLLRRLVADQARYPGALEDHAYLVHAYVELYEADLDSAWLEKAQGLLEKTAALFWAGDHWSSKAKDQEALGAAPGDEPEEGALPSPAGLLALEEARIAVLTGREAPRAWKELERAYGAIVREPLAVPTYLAALDALLSDSVEVVVSGKPGPETDALIKEARAPRISNRLIALVDGNDRTTRVLGPLAEGRAPGPKARAFVCVGKVCQAPVETPDALRALFDKLGAK